MIALTQVLVATDFSPASDSALHYGRALARAFHATLTVMHVVDDLAARLIASSVVFDASGDVGRAQRALETDAADRIRARLTEADLRDLRAEIVCVSATAIGSRIVAQARACRADLLVVGTHGRGGLVHVLLGSVAEHVVRSAPCPVLTVRHVEHEVMRPDALQVVAQS